MQYFITQNIRIDAEGYPETIDDRELTLEEMQEAVGGYIEMVPLSTKLIAGGDHPSKDDGQVYMIVNEEGLIMNLPYNKYASQIAGQQVVGTALFIKAEYIK
jgi:hypothetical protein